MWKYSVLHDKNVHLAVETTPDHLSGDIGPRAGQEIPHVARHQQINAGSDDSLEHGPILLVHHGLHASAKGDYRVHTNDATGCGRLDDRPRYFGLILRHALACENSLQRIQHRMGDDQLDFA